MDAELDLLRNHGVRRQVWLRRLRQAPSISGREAQTNGGKTHKLLGTAHLRYAALNVMRDKPSKKMHDQRQAETQNTSH